MAKYSPDVLVKWFRDKISQVVGFKKDVRKDLLSKTTAQRSSTILGKMYFYSYDPKWKDSLPIYDRYPLVFPIEPYSDGFLGLNLHYLNLGERQIFLARLEQHMTDRRYDENTRLRLSYRLMEQTKTLSSLGRPCVHRYLFNHVRSRFIEIPSSEWDKAAELPTELFVTKRK